MGTRGQIICKCENEYRSIYVHFDAYPDGVGSTLKKHYDSYDKVKELVSFGSVSSLYPTIQESTFYHRDRDEDLEIAIIDEFNWGEYKNMLSEDIFIEYIYIFENNQWICYDGSIEDDCLIELGI